MFYDRFCELCKKAEVTPANVADAIGVNKSTVYMWKKQGTTPKYETSKKLADYFGVTTDYLLGLSDEPNVRIATQADMDRFGGREPTEAATLAETELELIEKYKRLPLEDRQRIDLIVDYDFKRLLEDKK